MVEVLSRLTFAFMGWAVLLTIANPWFEDKRLRYSAACCVMLATISYIVGGAV